METPTYGMTNYPTLKYKRLLDNVEPYYNAVLTAKAEITEQHHDPAERLDCMIEYLQTLYDSLTKVNHKTSVLHKDVISYFKGEINFCQIAQEVMRDDS